MIKDILSINKNSTTANFLKDISGGKNCSVFGADFGSKSFLLAGLDRQIVYVSSDIELLKKVKVQFEHFNKSVQTIFFVESDVVVTSGKLSEVKKQQISAISEIIKEPDVILLTPEIFLQKFPTKQNFINAQINLKTNSKKSVKDLEKEFVNIGYSKTSLVTQPGEFSVLGDVVSCYPLNVQEPIRIDFFGDVIENIYHFNIDDFKRTKTVKNIVIAPATLTFINNSTDVINKLMESYEHSVSKLESDSIFHLKSVVEDVRLKIENQSYSSVENFISPLINCTSISDYFSSNALVVFDDVKQIFDATNKTFTGFQNGVNLLIKSGDVLPFSLEFYFSDKQCYKFKHQKCSFQQITSQNRLFEPDAVYSIKTSPVISYFNKMAVLLADIKYYQEYSYTTVIFCKDKQNANYLNKYLLQNNVKSSVYDGSIIFGGINIVPVNVSYGAIFTEEKVAIIGTIDLYGKDEKVLTKTRSKAIFSLPKIGDYVVHESYGIGLCVGIEKLKFSDYEKDYIILEYAKGDKLYLPTEKIELINAYINDGTKPKLNRLGGNDFDKVKQRVKDSIKTMAFNLIQLYAERESLKGFKYEIDKAYLKEFEDSFPFAETLDQKNAIKDVVNDMTSGKVMDRLICGDVGFGKTEVALRAIFISAFNGKQSVFLAPTTVLCEQHYNSCLQRLSPFGIKVAKLNRFQTASQQREIIKALINGEIDVVCGTHRLLSSDVKFKNLGVLVLDEEQRFGVQDKEKIKNLKKNIDVLTLSATPIPRTLHMGMVGIRDISIIATAPEGRLPVQSVITEYSDGLLLQSISREINRGGQVLIIYNRVNTILDFSAKVRNLLGNDINISVTHGQMPSNLLENEIYNLYSGKTQILISTTLIENGVDLPNANTLIIIDADKLGLSQLYQLRGRVGRSKTLGYAIFTYKKDISLTEDAYKRLNALMEFTELGSGFKIAMRDLEIRGCGNILGKEQHGHMEKVGYDLYCKILSETVKELRGEQKRVFKDVKIDVSLSCFISENYIPESENRFMVYSNLKNVNTSKDRLAILNQINEQFGQCNQEVENLSKVALLKNLSQTFNAKRVYIDKQKTFIEFYEMKDLTNINLNSAIKKLKMVTHILNENKPILTFDINEFYVERKLDILIHILETASLSNQ